MSAVAAVAMPSPDTHELASAGVAPAAWAAASTTGRVPPTPATVATSAADAVERTPLFIRRRSGVRALDHRLQQDLATGADIGFGRVLDLVVADAVLAGHEDHRGGGDAADVAGVVTGAAHDVHVRIACLLGATPHRVDQFLRERRRREVPDLLDLHIEPMALGDVGRGCAHFGVHLRQLTIVGMAEIDGHEYAARNGVARLRLAFEHAHRRAAVRPVADLAAPHDQLGRADQRIAPALHRRGAGVALHAGPRHLVPALPLRAGDDADRLLLALEDRPLLDMRLEERPDGATAA